MRQLDFAKSLRRNMTDAEQRLWKRLRAHRLNGEKFRRQQPIGPYIVDFVHFGSRLIIEADGGQHHESRGDAVATLGCRRRASESCASGTTIFCTIRTRS
nr:DUF559 domain-containing protein [Chromobacterium rhizoryzae]